MKNSKITLLGFLMASLASAAMAAEEPKAENREVPEVVQNIKVVETPKAEEIVQIPEVVKTEEVKKVDPQAIFKSKPHVILFKIHDITPVINADGVTTACAYKATFFNRTPTSLRQAKVDLEWKDLISEQFLSDAPMPEEPEKAEEKKDVKPEATKVENKKEVKEAVNPRDVVKATLDVPAISPLKQATLEGSVETDKCFMLFDDVKFNVSSCNLLEKDVPAAKNEKAGEKANPCAGLFQFVNSKNPEYYGEFREISYEELQEQKKTAEEKEQDKIRQSNEAINKNFETMKAIISEIK